MKQSAFAALFGVALALPAQMRGEEADSPATGQILIFLEEGTRMRLVDAEGGKRVALRGTGLALRELPVGVWRVRRVELDSLRQRLPELPADRFVFRVSANRITYIGSWTTPTTLMGGSLASTRGRPTALGHTESEAACACSSSAVFLARERWPAELAQQQLILACAARSDEAADAPPIAEADCAFAP